MEEKVYHQDKVEGFYYDHQIFNPLYTVTLHPNTRPIPGGSSPNWSQTGLVDCSNDMIIGGMKKRPNHTPDRHYDKEWDEFFTNGYSENSTGSIDGYLPPTSTGKWSNYYSEPICSSIFSEDFNFSFANEWTSWDGGNFFENTFKTVKPYAPFLGTLSNSIKKINPNGNSFGSDIASNLNGIVQKLGKAAEKMEPVLNKALYIQGTRFTMYNGTSTNFGNMTMKFTLLSDWRQWYPGELDKTNQPHFMTVYDQLAYLYPYCIGFFERGIGGEATGWIKEAISAGFAESVSQFANEYVGWQAPPGGYETINRNIDVQQKGTLRLILGGFYTIDNLIIKNVSVNLSRTLCKDPTAKELNKAVMVPLYADVTLELGPASVYTDVKLGRFLNNAGMNSIIKALSDAQLAELKAAIGDAKITEAENK